MVLRLIKIVACYGIGESLGIPTQILRQFIYKLCVGALSLYDFTDHREFVDRGQTLLTGGWCKQYNRAVLITHAVVVIALDIVAVLHGVAGKVKLLRVVFTYLSESLYAASKLTESSMCMGDKISPSENANHSTVSRMMYTIGEKRRLL